MAIRSDFHTKTFTEKLRDEAGKGIGWIFIKYTVKRSANVTDGQSTFGYIVHAHQRVVIPNTNGFALGAIPDGHNINYPVCLRSAMELRVSCDPNMNVDNTNKQPTAIVRCLDILPKTMNSTHNKSSSASLGLSKTHTSETSNSVSSSTRPFELTDGLAGLLFKHQLRTTHGNSTTSGSIDESQTSSNSADSASTTVKDWSVFGNAGVLVREGQATTCNQGAACWVWGQSYPWDILTNAKPGPQTKPSADTPVGVPKDGAYIRGLIQLPEAAQDQLLMDGKAKPPSVVPPSHISRFGLDFTMSAAWFVEPTSNVPFTADYMNVYHECTLFKGSHWGEGSGVSASITKLKTNKFDTLPSFSASEYALYPIGPASNTNAVILFSGNDFLIDPPEDPDPKAESLIVSPSNNVKVSAKGFAKGMKVTEGVQGSLEIVFKVANKTDNYSLSLKHWVLEDNSPQKLDIDVNGKWQGTLSVDHREGQGGQENISVIVLRDLDITSKNFHDYLVLGLNKITINITPPSIDRTYVLSALSID